MISSLEKDQRQFMLLVKVNQHTYRIEDWDPAPWAASRFKLTSIGLSTLEKPPSDRPPWKGKEEFMKKLALLQEKHAYELPCAANSGLAGYDHSRFEVGVLLGNTKFILDDVIWNGDLLNYYVRKFNVMPSNEFLTFVNEWQTHSCLYPPDLERIYPS